MNNNPYDSYEPECPFFLRVRYPKDNPEVREIRCEAGCITLQAEQALRYKVETCGHRYKDCPIYRQLSKYYYGEVYTESGADKK